MIVECPGCHMRYDVTGRPPNTKARCRCGTVFRLKDPASDAAMLNCPGCGAPCSPEKTRCDYCKSTLATVRCPRCFGLLFEGHKHCGHCGAAVDVPARALHSDNHTERQCPRCDQSLVANLVGGTLLDQCNNCGGLWIDQSAFEGVMEEREKQQHVTNALGHLPLPKGQVDIKAVKYLKCPDCEKLMNRRNFGKSSGVIIDVCGAHGIWFDRGELPKIIDFVRAGGLTEARRREVKQLEDKARIAKARRESERMHASTRGGGYFGDSLVGSESAVAGIAEWISRVFD